MARCPSFRQYKSSVVFADETTIRHVLSFEEDHPGRDLHGNGESSPSRNFPMVLCVYRTEGESVWSESVGGGL